MTVDGQCQVRCIRMARRYPKLPPAPAPSSPAVSASMRANKSHGTRPEIELANRLGSRGIVGYEPQYPDLPGTPDLAFPREKIAVFVNGCFWHRCPYCKPNSPKSNGAYWSVKFRRNQQRDANNRAALREIGWKPIVVWECVLRKNPAAVVRRIQRKLQECNGQAQNDFAV